MKYTLKFFQKLMREIKDELKKWSGHAVEGSIL